MSDKTDIRKIKDIEDRYGLMLFRMALSHLVDIGHRNLTDEHVEESISEIMAQADADEAGGKPAVINPQFQCEIVRCSAELAMFSIWTLFMYIKKYVEVSI